MTPLLAWRPWFVATIAAVMFFTNLGGTRLWDEDETKNARCGVEMHQRGEWVVPTFNDALRSHKPVLLYWAMRGSYATLGVSEFSARLPSALAGLLVVVMTYHLGRLLFDRAIGLLAGLLLASALMFSTLARAATPDGVLMIGTTGALLAFVAGVAKRRGGCFSGETPGATPLAAMRLPWWHTVAMYAAMGLAVLAKGPIGVLLPLWAVCIYGLFGETAGVGKHEGEADCGLRNSDCGLKRKRLGDVWRWFRAFRNPQSAIRIRRGLAWFLASIAPHRWISGAQSIRLGSGLLITAAVAAPWYVAVSLQTGGDWLAGFLGTHNVGRFATAMEGHDGPTVYYLVAIMAGFFPASCFLPAAVVGGVAQRVRGASLAPSYAFCLAVIFAWVGFFSLAATKLPNYVIPCYVGLAVLTAAWIVAQARRWEAAEKATLRSWFATGLASSAVAGVAVGIGLAFVGARLVDGAPWIGLAGLIPVVGGSLALVLLRRSLPHEATASFVAASLLFTLVGHTLVAPTASPSADGPRLADTVHRLERAGEPLRVATHRYTTPSLVWELDRHVPTLDASDAIDHLSTPAGVVAMAREAYDEIAAELPAGVIVLREENRFLRPDRQVVLVGRRDVLARRHDHDGGVLR